MAAPKTRGANPFDLSKRKRGGPEPPHPSRTYTEADQAELLVNYMEIRAEFWPFLRYQQHIRYLGKDGAFRPGGFVVRAHAAVQPAPEGAADAAGAADAEIPARPGLQLQNGFVANARNYARWTVPYDTIERLWVKPAAETLELYELVRHSVSALDSNMRRGARSASRARPEASHSPPVDRDRRAAAEER